MEFSHWKSRKLFQQLLAHVCSRAEIHRMSYSAKLAKLYAYSPEDHFKDLRAEEEQTEALAIVQRRAQRKPEVAVIWPMRESLII